MKTLLRGIAQFLFVIAAFFILVGGRAIVAFTKTGLVRAEMEGIGLGIVCGALGLAARSAGNDPDNGGDSRGQ